MIGKIVRKLFGQHKKVHSGECPSQLANLSGGNRFIGAYPELRNSSIHFGGKNNILYCEDGVILCDCSIDFQADNSLIFLSKSIKEYRFAITINNNSVCYFGRNNYFNGMMHIILSEHKHFFVGDNCLFSFDVWVRNADPHLIYSTKTKERINLTKSVFIGDHVWVGQSVMLLKGTKIDSGSILGARSVGTGNITHNSVWAGSPIRKIKDSIFWNGLSVHKWGEEETKKSLIYSNLIESQNALPDAYVFHYDEKESLPFEIIDTALDGSDSERKLEYLKQINANVKKNRFVHQLT